jgi:RNA polymerase sigma factor (TIGR02999 family)
VGYVLPGSAWACGWEKDVSSGSQITSLLARWNAGDEEAFKSLVSLVYAELRRLAHNRLGQVNSNLTVNTTALVHETYVRLAEHPPHEVKDRNHFFAIAATVMRRVLVDHARERLAAKRDGGIRLELQSDMMPASDRDVDLLALDEALDALSQLDQRQSRIVELRFFAGLSIEETAEVLATSPATVKRDWMTARAWLYDALSRQPKGATKVATHGT